MELVIANEKAMVYDDSGSSALTDSQLDSPVHLLNQPSEEARDDGQSSHNGATVKTVRSYLPRAIYPFSSFNLRRHHPPRRQ
jgi:hypothetical protein